MALIIVTEAEREGGGTMCDCRDWLVCMVELMWKLGDLGFNATVRFPLGRPDLRIFEYPAETPPARHGGEALR